MVLYLYSSFFPFFLFFPPFSNISPLFHISPLFSPPFSSFPHLYSLCFFSSLHHSTHPQEGRPIQQTSALDLLLSGVKGKVLCKGRLAVIRNFIISTVQFLPIIMMIILFKIIVLLMQNCICEENMTNIRYRMYI